MDWKLTAATFGAIFLAEMGDKTQLAAFALASGSSRWSVFIGASLALVVTTAIAVVTGSLVGRYVPLVWIKRAGGLFFIAIGAIMLVASARVDDAPEGGASADTSDVAEASDLDD